MKKSEIVAHALELISTPDGWVKKKYGDAGAYCSVGALIQSFRENGLDPLFMDKYFTVRDALQQTVAELHGSKLGHISLMSFNDREETTHEQVVEVFQKTIEKLEAVGS